LQAIVLHQKPAAFCERPTLLRIKRPYALSFDRPLMTFRQKTYLEATRLEPFGITQQHELRFVGLAANCAGR
jgi:hypothetical protein